LDRRESAIRVLSLLGQYYVLIAYGLFAFGLVLLGGPGVLLAAAGSPDERTGAEVLAVLGTGALAALGIFTATFLCRQRILRREYDRSRLPLLWMTVGNVGAAALGGLLQVGLLTAAGIFGVVLYFPLFLLVDRGVYGAQPLPMAYSARDLGPP
jgi:hypothetical protein